MKNLKAFIIAGLFIMVFLVMGCRSSSGGGSSAPAGSSLSTWDSGRWGTATWSD